MVVFDPPQMYSLSKYSTPPIYRRCGGSLLHLLFVVCLAGASPALLLYRISIFLLPL